MSENMKLRCAVCGAQTKPFYYIADDERRIESSVYAKGQPRKIGALRYCVKCGTVKVVGQ